MKANVVVFIIVAVVAVAGLVTGLVIQFTKGPEDAGMKARPGLMGSGNVELRPGVLDVVGDETVDAKVLSEAAAWWAAQKQPHRFAVEVNGERARTELSQALSRRKAVVMSVAEIATESGGLTTIHYDKVTGTIIAAEVVINHEHTYNAATYLGAVKHELGEVLGLEDDPNPGLDLNSIMRLKLNPGGVLTAHDAALLRGE